MGQPATPSPVALVGVYNADGGIVGEARYVIGHLLGTAHCALCDITHSPVRRKPAWDALVARLGLPFELVHLNEMPADIAPLMATSAAPLVVVRLSDGTVAVLLDADSLDALDGSVDGAESALRNALESLTTA